MIRKALLLLLLLPTPLVGSDYFTAFPEGACEGTMIGEYTIYNTAHFWDDKGKRRSNSNDFERQQLTFYGEYGLSWCGTLTAEANYGLLDESMNGTASGFVDFRIGFKHLIWEAECQAISLEGIAIIPASEYRPALRYGRGGGELNLLYSRLFDQAWCDVRLGYRAYSTFPSDQLRADAKVGYTFNEYFQLTTGAYLDYGLFNGRNQISQSNFYLNPNYRLLRAKVQGIINVCNIPVMLDYFWHVWGRNVGTGGGFTGSIQLDF